MQALPEVAYPLCGITFIPVHANIRKNAPVLTSDLSGNTPGNLPVGRISGISTRHTGISKDHVYKQTALRPFADPSSLRFAAVYVKVDPHIVKSKKSYR